MIWIDRIIMVVLVLLMGVTLYSAVFQLLELFLHFYRSRCPKCGKRGMKIVGGVVATMVVNGKRVPDSFTSYECEKCGTALTWHRRQWEEWEFALLDHDAGESGEQK